MSGSLHLLEIVGGFLSFALLVNNSPSPIESTFEWGEVCYHSLRSGIITSSHYHAPCLLSSVPYQCSFFTSTQNELWKATPHTCSMKINSPYSGGPMSSAKLKLHTPQRPRPHPLGDFLFPEYAKLVPFSVTPVSPCLENLFTTTFTRLQTSFSSGIAFNLTPAVSPDHIILRHLPLLLLYTTLFSFSVLAPTYLCLDGNNNVAFCRRLPSIRLQSLQWQWLCWVSGLLPA